jgi:hypothetical protein
MILKFFFKQLSVQKQIDYLKKKGIMIGTRTKNRRKIYTYMLQDIFVEVLYKNDNDNDSAEKVNLLSGLKNLNSYLEREFKTSF